MRRGRGRGLGLGLLLLAAAAGAAVHGGGPVPAAAPEVVDLLGGVDFVPPRSAIDDTLGDGAVDQLIAFANDDGGDTDPGLRIRAYRALAEYPGAETQGVLVAAIDEFAAAESGVETLYLRAAMQSLAIVAGEGAIEPLRVQLDHEVKDVRADAAFALAVTGAAAAVPHLRQRLVIESDPQVRIALSEAIRALTQPE